ncbi:hypothetical protein Baya_9141 [Bagarius yarrelli]|uniref:Uncharacterized protein n=1 Tax=Bagarius yarrelli TaxID=175774 RepID=A0A556U6U6_BAGYA|nr:hypothetical protein Baya_9141 [Bagarius yarrelli]
MDEVQGYKGEGTSLISAGRVRQRKSRPNGDETIQSAEIERNGRVMRAKSKPMHEEGEAILYG